MLTGHLKQYLNYPSASPIGANQCYSIALFPRALCFAYSFLVALLPLAYHFALAFLVALHPQALHLLAFSKSMIIKAALDM